MVWALSTLTSDIDLLRTLSGQKFNDIDSLNSTQSNDILTLKNYFDGNSKLKLTNLTPVTYLYLNLNDGDIPITKLSFWSAVNGNYLYYNGTNLTWNTPWWSTIWNPYNTSNWSFTVQNITSWGVWFNFYGGANGKFNSINLGYWGIYTGFMMYYYNIAGAWFNEYLILGLNAWSTNTITIQNLQWTKQVVIDSNFDLCSSSSTINPISDASYTTKYYVDNKTIDITKLNISGASTNNIIKYNGTNAVWWSMPTINSMQDGTNNAYCSLNYILNSSTWSDAKFYIYSNQTNNAESELFLTNNITPWRGFILKWFMHGSTAINDYFSLTTMNTGTNTTIFDYNSSYNSTFTFKQNVFIMNGNLYNYDGISSWQYALQWYVNQFVNSNNCIIQTSSNKINFTNWTYTNPKFIIDFANTNSYVFNFNNGGVYINDAINWTQTDPYSAYRYFTAGATNYNWTNCGTVTISLKCQNRIWCCSEIDCTSSRKIKNIINEENNISYENIINDLLKLPFYEYQLKYENTGINYIGLISEETLKNKFFWRYVNSGGFCDYPNVKKLIQ